MPTAADLPNPERYQVYAQEVQGRGTMYAVRENMDSPRGSGDPLFETPQQAQQEADRMRQRDQQRAEAAAEQRKRDAAEQKKRDEQANLHGFMADAPDVQRHRAVSTLNRKMRFSDEGVMMRKAFIEKVTADGSGHVRDGRLYWRAQLRLKFRGGRCRC